MGRIARIICPGMPHHVVYRGNRKSEIFFCEEDKIKYLALFRKACETYNVTIWAWCLMPNHIHSILEPKDENGLSKAMQWLARNYSAFVNEKYGWTGHLWEDRFFSCVIESDERLWKVLAYIENNPVRAGLVKSPEDWEWSSAKYHISGIRNNIVPIRDWFAENEKTNYIFFVKERISEEEMKRIRLLTKTGRPFGSAEFINTIEKKIGRAVRPKKRGPRSKGNK